MYRMVIVAPSGQRYGNDPFISFPSNSEGLVLRIYVTLQVKHRGNTRDVSEVH